MSQVFDQKHYSYYCFSSGEKIERPCKQEKLKTFPHINKAEELRKLFLAGVLGRKMKMYLFSINNQCFTGLPAACMGHAGSTALQRGFSSDS